MHVSKASMGLLKKQKAQRGIAAAQSCTALLVEPFRAGAGLLGAKLFF